MIVNSYVSVCPLTTGGERMDTDPEVMEVTEVVVTGSPVVTVSIIAPPESIELTAKELDVPWYLVF